MGETYTNGKEKKTRDYYRKRLNYNVLANEGNNDNLVNFHFAEKLLYGRVDRDFVPMVYNPQIIKLKKFGRNHSQGESFSAVNFVVDAFEGLARQFDKCVQLKKIDPADPFLSSLKIYRAYENPNVLYNQHKEVYFNALASTFRTNGIQVKNFSEFIKELLPILQRTGKKNAFTMPAYIKSKRCPITVSGLVIEIADIDPKNDQEKVDTFINSNNWDFYLNACNSYGFMVDKFIPWRLVADIGSFPHKSPMFDYAENYGLSSTDAAITATYLPAYFNYYDNFKADLLRLYNIAKPDLITEFQECGGSIIVKESLPQEYTLESLEDEFSDAYFMKLYFNIRCYEEETPLPENQKLLLMGDCEELRQSAGHRRALQIFERIINKTFDYNGSLSYIKKRLDLIKADEFDQEEGTRGSNAFSGY